MTIGSSAVKSFYSIPGPRALPFIGSSYLNLFGTYRKEKYHLVLRDLYKQYGPICRQRIGNREVIHVFHPEDIQSVYGQEGKFPHVYPLQISALTDEPIRNIAKGLGSRLNDDWWKLRKNGQPAFLKPRMVSQHISSVNDVAKELAERIQSHKDKNGEIENLNREIGIWYFENTMRIGCARNMNSFEDGSPGRQLGTRIVDMNDEFFYISAILKLSLPFYKYYPTPKVTKLLKVEKEFIHTVLSVIKDTLQDFEKRVDNKSLKDDDFLFLRYLLGRSELSSENIYTLMMSFLTDGLSTTVPTLLFNIYSLAKNPQSQEKVYEEIQHVLKDDTSVTSDHLKNMQYLKAFIKETLRLYPSGTEVSRITDKDLILSGYEIPKGTQVDLNFGPMLRNEAVFEDADSHKPERWLRNDVDSQKMHPYMYLPFSHGTRMCIGRRFAEQDMNVVLIHLLRKFKLHYVEEEVGQIFKNLLFPDRIMRVRFTPRH